jgi:ankyrin repeat protein
MAGDDAQVDELLRVAPDLAQALVARHPTAIARAAALGHTDAVRLLAGLGVDVNHKQRTTALHEAAWTGDRPLADLLLSLGADPAIRDDEFNATPSGWADHAHHEELAAYLASLEPDA